jgi:uncharacterized protein HemY
MVSDYAQFPDAMDRRCFVIDHKKSVMMLIMVVMMVIIVMVLILALAIRSSSLPFIPVGMETYHTRGQRNHPYEHKNNQN